MKPRDNPELKRISQSAWTSLPPRVRFLIPPDDAWALTKEGRRLMLNLEAERRLALSAWLLKPENGKGRMEFFEKSNSDARFFFRNCIWTKDPERRMGAGVEIPLVPFNYQLNPVPLVKGVTAGGWVSSFQAALRKGERCRMAWGKSRRMMASISLAGLYTWAMRHEPGFAGWMSSVKEDRIDAGVNFDAILGKQRFIWNRVHDFYPWYYPELPPWGTSSVNKHMYIQFPEWRIDGEPVAKECWENCTVGAMPGESGRRGGASLAGAADEAAWTPDFAKYVDDIEASTTLLILASTSGDPNHPFEQRVNGRYNYQGTITPVLVNPMMMDGAFEDPDGEDHVPYIRRTRSRYICAELEGMPPDVFARNVGCNPRVVAGARVLASFVPSRNAGSPDPKAPDFELYDPRWRTELWFDAGRADAWAWWWVQVSDATGEVRLVDYWMRENVSVEWWIPLLLGWPPHMRDRWLTMPDRQPWKTRVPWAYGQEDLEVCALWAERYAKPHGKRPVVAFSDVTGIQRTANYHWTIAEILANYGIAHSAVTAVHNVENCADHANNVVTRTRIEGRIAERHPFSGGVSFPSPIETFMHWEWMPPTPRNPRRKWNHDIYSHPATAFIHGSMHLATRVPHKMTAGEKGRPIAVPDRPSKTLQRVTARQGPHRGSLYRGPVEVR